jgi:hypothetical protein
MQPFFQGAKHEHLQLRPFAGADESGMLGLFYHSYADQAQFGPYFGETGNDLVRAFRGMQLWDYLLPEEDEVDESLIRDCWTAGRAGPEVRSVDDRVGEQRDVILASPIPSLDGALSYLWENEILFATEPLYDEARAGTLEVSEVVREVTEFTLLLIKGGLTQEYQQLHANLELRRMSYNRQHMTDYLDGARRIMTAVYPRISDSFKIIGDCMPKQEKKKEESTGLFDTLTRSFRRSDLLDEVDSVEPLYKEWQAHRVDVREALNGLQRNFDGHRQEIHLDVRLLSYNENFARLSRALSGMRDVSNRLAHEEGLKQAEHLAIRNRLHDLIVYFHVQIMEYLGDAYELDLSVQPKRGKKNGDDESE